MTGDRPAVLVTLYGSSTCADTDRTRALLDRLGVTYRYVETEADEAVREHMRGIAGRANTPLVVYPDGSHATEPSDEEAMSRLRELGLTE